MDESLRSHGWGLWQTSHQSSFSVVYSRSERIQRICSTVVGLADSTDFAFAWKGCKKGWPSRVEGSPRTTLRMDGRWCRVGSGCRTNPRVTSVRVPVELEKNLI